MTAYLFAAISAFTVFEAVLFYVWIWSNQTPKARRKPDASSVSVSTGDTAKVGA